MSGGPVSGGPVLPEPGTWSLRRRVDDRRTGQRGAVTGLLLVVDEQAGGGPGQRWTESGVLTWAGAALPVTRTLLLRPGADGAWWVLFADGRPFHPWTPGAPVEHPCAADLYRGRVDLRGARMVTRWVVTGPAKDQVLVTALRRRPGSAAPPGAAGDHQPP